MQAGRGRASNGAQIKKPGELKTGGLSEREASVGACKDDDNTKMNVHELECIALLERRAGDGAAHLVRSRKAGSNTR